MKIQRENTEKVWVYCQAQRKCTAPSVILISQANLHCRFLPDSFLTHFLDLKLPLQAFSKETYASPCQAAVQAPMADGQRPHAINI